MGVLISPIYLAIFVFTRVFGKKDICKFDFSAISCPHAFIIYDIQYTIYNSMIYSLGLAAFLSWSARAKRGDPDKWCHK